MKHKDTIAAVRTGGISVFEIVMLESAMRAGGLLAPQNCGKADEVRPKVKDGQK